MWRNRNRNEDVAGACPPRHALPFQSDLLTIGDAGRNLDIDILAGGQPQSLGHAAGRVRQCDRERGMNVGADA
jgi:hypothetical protein